MSTLKDMVQLGQKVAGQHGWAVAKAFKAYAMSDADRAVLSACALDLLQLFPAIPDASALMSAALAVSLERRMAAPVQVVSGTLWVDGVNPFAQDYSWVMIGPYVVDLALFRTAYAAWGPARLAKHIDLVFGPGKGVYVDLWKRTARHGLRYDPRDVLGSEDVTRLMGEAFHIIKQAQAN